ncbi:hypothetical protein M407DRAFT_17920 [Tulasnella calospora MUT 4182]|uniref:DRBM domain-containing protein n=1 Tax=Tulasnella calospora MUT 4182 TaxID=1051891 RepID=A0A0C3MI91_9AGAM|nr:hypothetical protein M407DRAFT_17920 [Tulasnella calospora MUT 4182]
MSSNSKEQYRMFLNTIQQAGHATFDVKLAESMLPGNKPAWAAVVTVTGVSPALSRYIYIGTAFQALAPSKGEARDAACLQMLNLFASYGILPGQKR